MTEAEAEAKYRSDTNADSGKPGLESDEVASLLRDWFYSAGSFSPSLVAGSNYARAVAAGWRKQAGKSVDPRKYVSGSGGAVSETESLNRNCRAQEKSWLEEAARVDEAARASANTSGAPGTRVVGVSPKF